MKKIYLLILLFSINKILIFAQPVIGFSPIISSGLTVPIDIANANDGSGRLFIAQQNGIIKIDSAGTLLATPFLNVSSIITYDVGGERGLLSIAFHPHYATNRYFFIYYNNAAGNVTIAQYRTMANAPDQADPASGKVLMTITKPFTNHNGGKLNFGPDGDLYFGTGDGGSEGDPNNNSQNGLSLLGKMIRINVDNFTTPPYFTVPANNPFMNDPNVLDSIYALGLRNPWRWSFDRLTGDMWLPDVGQNLWEEVNYRTFSDASGVNYGWRCYEGDSAYDLSQCGATPTVGKVFPIFTYGHNPAGGYVITGGYVYRGSEFPDLQGYYLCSDYETGNAWLIKPDGAGNWSVAEQTGLPTSLSSYGEGEDGTLYAVSLTAGILYKVVTLGIVPVNLISFSAQNNNGKDHLKWVATYDPSTVNFGIERSTNGTDFLHIADVAPQDKTVGTAYQFYSSLVVGGLRYYRIKITYSNGASEYSSIASIDDDMQQKITVHYDGTKQLQLSLPYAVKELNLVNSTGVILNRYNDLPSGQQIINMTGLPGGIYYLQCLNDNMPVENIKVVNQ